LDVERTLSEIDFFASHDFQQNLSMLLYLWSKDNKDLSYRQGMNEILAILVYAFHCEMIEDGTVEGQE